MSLLPFDLDTAAEGQTETPFQGRRRQELFLELLAEAERDIRGYVYTLVVNRDDARDVFQEVCVMLWRDFEHFEFGTDFRRWANAIAHRKAQSYWRDRGRRREQVLGDQALARLATVYSGADEILEIRRRWLRECIAALKSDDRALVGDIYLDAKPAAEAAERRKVSLATLYKRLSRVRKRLTACVGRKMA